MSQLLSEATRDLIVCEQRSEKGKWGQGFTPTTSKGFAIKQARLQASDFHSPLQSETVGALGMDVVSSIPILHKMCVSWGRSRL